jgi:hypothetical protein
VNLYHTRKTAKFDVFILFVKYVRGFFGETTKVDGEATNVDVDATITACKRPKRISKRLKSIYKRPIKKNEKYPPGAVAP